ncbi:MAG: hypothetical protein QOJ72_2036 [Nocardioidaceae bacterium]|jgi:hypothetical protein|nr:hypothetical protein [Nocardioidaceae bacterium]
MRWVRSSVVVCTALLLLAACARSGNDVAQDDIATVAGILQEDWQADHPVKAQSGRQLVGDGSLDLALEQSGVDKALIHPLAASGNTSDPDGATIDLLITVETVKNGNGVLVRRNTAGKGTECFRYTLRNTGTSLKVTCASLSCPK